jgi:uncharacterized protein (DUF2225 family)
MDNNIFSGLEDLGFDDTDELNLYSKPKEEPLEEDLAKTIEDSRLNEIEKQKSLLYDKEITCPSCNHVFNARAVKTSAYRVVKKESDFFTIYSSINPYFYDVWLCNVCGYASLKADFEKIKSSQIELVQNKLSVKWHGKKYPEVYDINIAIERYKLALLNYAVMDSKSSKKAMTCLKLAWMYRINEESENEQVFLTQALEGFSDAYFNESFPFYGMDRFTVMYLIGELNRRINNFDEALKWFSNIITTQNVSQKLKELARDQKDLIRTAESESTEKSTLPPIEEKIKENKKQGFFSSFFKK